MNAGTETPHPRHLLRSVSAVSAGLLFIIIISAVTDVVMHATGVFPPWFQPMADALWWLALGYRIVYGVSGGYLTARLAPDHPVRHALILGVIGLVLSLAGAVATWNAGPEYGPGWYASALVAIALPTAWLGGKLGAGNRAR